MIAESRELIEKYHQYFKRLPHYQYWLVIVDNHFFDRYYFFIYSRKLQTKLVRSTNCWRSSMTNKNINRF